MSDDQNRLLAENSKKVHKQLFAKHVSSAKVAFFESAGIDFILGKRDGPFMWDAIGDKKLINCHCNGGVYNLGHRNPEIIETMKKSLEYLDIGNHHLISEPRAQLAAQLAELLPGNLQYTIFGVSGGEAIDLSIKIARGFTKQKKIISAIGGYHGHTGYALAAGDVKFSEPFGETAPGFVKIPFNDIPALELAIDDFTAAVIFETIPATLGLPIPDAHFYKQVRSLCDKHGALLIIDEIQTGFGRTGRLWGIEHFDVTPDILVLGKGMSGGIYPMSATCITKELESVFHKDPFAHISTFGGAEVGCSVALKVLHISSQQTFLDHVNRLADLFQQGFIELQKKASEIACGFASIRADDGHRTDRSRSRPPVHQGGIRSGFFLYLRRQRHTSCAISTTVEYRSFIGE